MVIGIFGLGNTGVDGQDQITFDSYDGTKAIANIAIGPEQLNGFVLRSTFDWDTAEKEFVIDLFLSTKRSLTKAYITAGRTNSRCNLMVLNLVIDKGLATFYYRSPALFANDAMDAIQKVELKFNGDVLPMTYEADNERFVLGDVQVPNGKTPYSYLVTIDGQQQK
ncbi:hypothetical protein [Bacillus sp. HMF5848]|uniref:hypothetical protein n=1 Tax=Bacillus sp. HMF5848 TaxID=2495421 RepID=UPI0021AE2282|nr:hypothetical protein [Bacillus sp. HMF5848]